MMHASTKQEQYLDINNDVKRVSFNIAFFVYRLVYTAQIIQKEDDEL